MKIDEKLSDDLLRKEIGLRLANARILLRLKQTELASRSGISRFCLSRIENGAGGVSFDSVLSVMRQLRLLSGLNFVFREPTIPLHDLVLKEKKAQIKLPVRVRNRKAKNVVGARVWGDGERVGHA